MYYCSQKSGKICFKYWFLFLLLGHLFIGCFRSVFSEVHKQLLFLPFFSFLNFHLKKALVLEISRNNETITGTKHHFHWWIFLNQQYVAMSVSRMLGGSISKAVPLWLRRDRFWEILQSGAPADFRQFLPRHYVLCVCFIHFVCVNTWCTFKMRVRELEGQNWEGEIAPFLWSRGRGREMAQLRARSRSRLLGDGKRHSRPRGKCTEVAALLKSTTLYWIGWNVALIYLVCLSLWVFSLLKYSNLYLDKTRTFCINTSWPFVGSHSEDKHHLKLYLGQEVFSQTTDYRTAVVGLRMI